MSNSRARGVRSEALAKLEMGAYLFYCQQLTRYTGVDYLGYESARFTRSLDSENSCTQRRGFLPLPATVGFYLQRGSANGAFLFGSGVLIVVGVIL